MCRPAFAVDPPAPAEIALQAKHAELQPQWLRSADGTAFTLNSEEGADRVQGDIHAEVDSPFARVKTALKSAASLCEMLFLHLNVRSCEASAGAGGETLLLTLGPKLALAPGINYSMQYKLGIEVDAASYLRVSLAAATGPLLTEDYRIVIEAVPIAGDRTFVHVGYGYQFGVAARMAMQAYLSTAGRSKIGFTALGAGADGKALYVRGERASLERNVMRNYLALQAYTSVSEGSPPQQMESRLRGWFALTEHYAAQLHEFSLDEYLREKHGDIEKMAVSQK